MNYSFTGYKRGQTHDHIGAPVTSGHDYPLQEALLEEKWLIHHPPRSPRWKRGEVIMWSYKDPDFPDLIDCRPVTVVDDGEENLVVWLALGTRMLHHVLEGGADIRTIDGPARFTSPRAQAVRTWSGSGILAVFQPDTMYSVWFFETEPGVRDTYYINIEQPYLRTANGIESSDLILDVVASGTQYKYKDKDELAFAREAGVINDSLHERIHRAAEQAIAAFQARDYPFNAGYEQFQPDPSWPTPDLPPETAWQYET